MGLLKRFAIFLVATVVCFVAPASTYALSEEQLNFYAQNGIFFYEPGAGGGNCYGTLMGSTVFEKVLSGLLNMGLNEVAAAGVYSNMMAEGFGNGGLLVHEYGVNSRAKIGTYYSAATAYGPNGLYVTEADVRDLYNPEIMHGMGPNGWSYGMRVFLLEVLEEYGVEKYATEWDDVNGVYTYDNLSYDQMREQFGVKEADKVLTAVLDYFDRLYIKNEYADKGYNFIIMQNDIDAQGLSKYGIRQGMTLLEALNLVSTPLEAAELFFTTGEMWGLTTFGSHSSHGDKAYEGLELIRSAGLTASGATNCSGNGDIVETALALAWNMETEGRHDKSDPKPEYATAMRSVGTWYASGPCNGSGACAPNGASCDIFVSTVMRYSGADKEFPPYGPGRQQDYMLNNPEKYKEIDNLGDTSNLEAGDIFVVYANSHSHILIYMGVEDGKWMQASASFNGRTGEYFNYQEYGQGSDLYRIFRKV
jgi:hypothetical protein